MDKRRRRKSLSIFRPQLSALTTIHDNTATTTAEKASPISPNLNKKSRYSAISRQDTPPSPLSRESSDRSFDKQISQQTKSKQKSRPRSIFDSLNSYYSFDDDKEPLTATTSNSLSINDIPSPTVDEKSMVLLHHGEVQVAGSMFRKRCQYLVLTDTHLLRFKSQSRAAEVFPEIPESSSRNSSTHHRMSSGGSGSESHLQNDPQTMTPLQNMVAVYKQGDGKQHFSIELASYDESSNTASTTSIQFTDPQDADLWLSCLQAAITKSRLSGIIPFGQTAIGHVVKYLEAESDYVPSHFRIFIVTQRGSKTGAHSSTEDLHKLVSNISYLVIGLHKVHLIPLPRLQRFGSGTSLSDSSGTSHGIASLIGVSLQPCDDAFHVSFRNPLQPSSTLYLASTSAQDIALCLRQAADFIRPLWLDQPFAWLVPSNLDDNLLPVSAVENEDHFSFDRTLTAYCVSYGIDPSNIRYTVNYDCEDAPEFTLLAPNNSKRNRYTTFELLAVLRALRYNESFRSISFYQVKLDAIHNICDRYGSEHFSWSSKTGQQLPLPRLDSTPLLVQELQCLALKSTQLRKVDFSDCITRKSTDLNDQDRGSGICEAIFPLWTLQLTNIDWVSLNGIALSFLDLEYLRAAGCRKACRFRGLEMSRCSLSEDAMDFALSNIQEQEASLEYLDLSNNPARMHPESLTRHLEDFTTIRRLNLSRFSFISSTEPVLPTSLLMLWKLEVLDLSSTTMNTESVDSLAAYLMSPQSSTLQVVRLENCKMSGEDVATLLCSSVHGHSKPRNLHLFVSGNRLEKNHHKLIKAVSQSSTPTHLTMQALEYSDEKSFRNLLHALASNRSLEYLDISRISIPYDASEEACEKLKFMFENNCTLKEFDISGEVAHLEAVTLGRGICEALRGLNKNDTLEVLRIENQALGFPGAEALATVLENSSSLREIYCDNNQMGLQAFSMLVNAIKVNESLLWLAAMSKDRHWTRGKIEKEAEDYITAGTISNSISTKSSVRKVLSNAVPGRSSSNRSLEKHSPSRVTEQDLEAAMARIDDSWDIQIQRLSEYLTRNYNRTYRLNLSDFPAGGSSRPTTMNSLRTALEAVSLDETPQAEYDRQLSISSANELKLEKEVSVEIYEEDSDNGLMMV